MRVMVSLNLADIMSASRSTTPTRRYETSNDELDPATPSHDSQLATNSESTAPRSTEASKDIC